MRWGTRSPSSRRRREHLHQRPPAVPYALRSSAFSEHRRSPPSGCRHRARLRLDSRTAPRPEPASPATPPTHTPVGTAPAAGEGRPFGGRGMWRYLAMVLTEGKDWGSILSAPRR
jgi:hypothetical protein